MLALVVAILLTGGLDALLRFTSFGRSLRAAAADVEAATITGVNPHAVYAAATAIAVGILGVAAVFQSLRSTVSPSDGPAQLLYAFEAVIIGGLGSIWGAFLAPQCWGSHRWSGSGSILGGACSQAIWSSSAFSRHVLAA